MSVTLRKRKNSNGTTSLRLDIWHNDMHKIETLKHLKLVKPSTLADREKNKKFIELAEIIARSRATELEANNYDVQTDVGKKTIITIWMQSYVDTYTKKDKRNMQGVLNRFKGFLEKQKKAELTFANLNALIIEDFIEYLEAGCNGEGASSYYSRFKKMLKYAYRKKLMKENVLEFVERKVKGKAKKKDILTLDELKILAAAPIENKEIRRAFLFSACSGLRWIDIKALQWSAVNLGTKKMNLSQSKTDEDLCTPLNETAIKLLGEPGKRESLVFNLPSANGANKTLKAWVKRANIDKIITWHNGRHSFGTNLIYNDVDLLTTSKLLGHTSLKHTQRYVKAAMEMKEKGTSKINFDL